MNGKLLAYQQFAAMNGKLFASFFCQNSESSNNMVAHQILSHQKQTEEKVLTGRPLKHTPSKFDMPPEKMILDGGFQSKWNMSLVKLDHLPWVRDENKTTCFKPPPGILLKKDS